MIAEAYAEWLHNLTDRQLLIELRRQLDKTPCPPPDDCPLEIVLEECDRRDIVVLDLITRWHKGCRLCKRKGRFDPGFDMLFFPSRQDLFIGWLAFVRRDGVILDYVALSRPSYESRLCRSIN